MAFIPFGFRSIANTAERGFIVYTLILVGFRSIRTTAKLEVLLKMITAALQILRSVKLKFQDTFLNELNIFFI